MSLEEAIAERERAIISSLRSAQAGMVDRTGKGSEAEFVVEREILLPHLPPGFRCGKGCLVESKDPAKQSPAFDRVIFDSIVCGPLLSGEFHSVFPIEAAVGVVEITMRLDASKLREDVVRMAEARAMRGIRAYAVGLPENEGWRPETIAQTFLNLQSEAGTSVHGLYVLGIGFFQTKLRATENPPGVVAWLGPDRLFRFTEALRVSLNRWRNHPNADLSSYVKGEPTHF